jgi:hypothetical protein
VARPSFERRTPAAPARSSVPWLHLDESPKVPLKEQQRRVRRDRNLIRIATVVLVFTAAAFLVTIGVLVATHA